MAFEEMLNALERRRTKALAMGGPDKLAKRREMGMLSARERLDYVYSAKIDVMPTSGYPWPLKQHRAPGNTHGAICTPQK